MKEIRDAVALFEQAHNVTPSYDSETSNSGYTRAPSTTYETAVDIKMSHRDYQAGAVKIYTSDEIEEYMNARFKRI